jgi:hypothetical protein
MTLKKSPIQELRTFAIHIASAQQHCDILRSDVTNVSQAGRQSYLTIQFLVIANSRVDRVKPGSFTVLGESRVGQLRCLRKGNQMRKGRQKN